MKRWMLIIALALCACGCASIGDRAANETPAQSSSSDDDFDNNIGK